MNKKFWIKIKGTRLRKQCRRQIFITACFALSAGIMAFYSISFFLTALLPLSFSLIRLLSLMKEKNSLEDAECTLRAGKEELFISISSIQPSLNMSCRLAREDIVSFTAENRTVRIAFREPDSERGDIKELRFFIKTEDEQDWQQLSSMYSRRS